MKSLLIVKERLARPHEGRVLAWTPALNQEDPPPARLPGDEDAADEAAMAWTKEFGRKKIRAGRTLRDILVYEGTPLWWAAEIYLYYQTRATDYVRTIETFFRILEREAPEEVTAPDMDPLESVLLSRVCTALGILSDGPPVPPALPFRLRTAQIVLERRVNSFKTAAGALKTEWAGPPGRPPADSSQLRVALLSHAAFWRTGSDGRKHEHYFDRLLPSLEDREELVPFVLGVGPTEPFQKRGLLSRVRDWVRLSAKDLPYVPIQRFAPWGLASEVRRATTWMTHVWRELRRLPALQDAFTHRGVRFFDFTEPDFAALMLLQIPWAYRTFREMERALSGMHAQALVLYAESSGYGRVALEAARSLGVPSVAIQHGILYPKYFSYRHDPDEGGCPRPTATALFGEAARDFLLDAGRYDPQSLVTTGSPKFDALLETAQGFDRAALRARHGIGDAQLFVLVASRYHGILPTHRSIGSAFSPLLRAAASRPDVRIVVKPHPAEGREEYQGAIAEVGLEGASVVAPDADLVELLWAADILVTVESLSAVEALVLGRRVLVLNMPTNLKELVEAGAALGVASGADPGEALDTLLKDEEASRRLEQARKKYLSRVAMGVDGKATERIVGLVAEKAREGPGVVGS
jgi:glycosyltransferase involved in cell wall biosynthesis